MTPLRICVAGASDGTLAVRVAAAGHAVSMLARAATLAALRRDGLTLQDQHGAGQPAHSGKPVSSTTISMAPSRSGALATKGAHARQPGVLRNHGGAVCESSIARAVFLLWTVERAAEIQLGARSIAGPDVQLADGVRTMHAAQAPC